MSRQILRTVQFNKCISSEDFENNFMNSIILKKKGGTKLYLFENNSKYFQFRKKKVSQIFVVDTIFVYFFYDMTDHFSTQRYTLF